MKKEFDFPSSQMLEYEATQTSEGNDGPSYLQPYK